MDKNISLGLIVIGDEILSGRTKDTNINTVACFCEENGIELKEVRVISDNEEAIIDAVNYLRKTYTYVFTTGGIGGTHDDITAKSIAKAFDRPFIINEEATKIIKEHYKENLTNTRMSLAYMPKDIELIKNPVSKVPSFYIENVFVLAGMPSVMKGMLSDVETKIEKGFKKFTNSITSSALEGIIGEDLAKIQEQHPSVSIGSYPFYNPPNIGSTIVLRSKEKNNIIEASKKVFVLLKKYDPSPYLELQVPFD